MGSSQPQQGGEAGGGAESLTAGNPSQVYLKRCGESVGTERRRRACESSAEAAAAGEPKRSKVTHFHFQDCKVQQNSHKVRWRSFAEVVGKIDSELVTLHKCIYCNLSWFGHLTSGDLVSVFVLIPT